MSALGHARGSREDLLDRYPGTGDDWQTAHYDSAAKGWRWTAGQDYQNTRDNLGLPWQIVTVYETGGHNIWSRIYSDRKLYDWLLLQARP
jgi:hypothetical protein